MMKKTIRFILLLLMMTMLWTCAPSPSPDSEDHPRAGTLFRHRWWNYYLRGLERAEQQDFEAARSDLKSAMARREGDQRMARTYGMRFIDYFAHRELGIVHWLCNDLEAARAELARSIEDTPSAKAHHYLDRVRKALIKRNGPSAGDAHILLDLPPGLYWTRQDPVTLTGRIQDPNFVSQVSIGGAPLYLEGSQNQFNFQHHLKLPPGRHTVVIKATNLAGKTDSRAVNIAVDRQGPWIVITHLSRQKGRTVVKGALFDDAGAAELTCNQDPVALTRGPDTEFSFSLAGADTPLQLTAKDRLGNATHVRLPLEHGQTVLPQSTLVAGTQPYLLLAGWRHRDKEAPHIQFEQWQETQTVYMDKVVLSGSVRDKSNVTDLTINGVPMLPRVGPMVVFSHFVALQPGQNKVAIQARDTAGNLTRKQLTIIRKVPEALLLDHRLRLSVFPFELKGERSADNLAFQDDFIDQLVQRRRFQVVERQRLDLILEEQKLTRTRLIEPSTALRLGRLAAAHVIVTGRIVNTRTGTEIVGRLIDSETAEILTTVDAYAEKAVLPGIRHMAAALALKIHRDFPLVDGSVLEKKGKMIFTNLGAETIRAQRRLLVYDTRAVQHPSTGAVLGKDHRILAKARVTQCDKALSKAQLQEGFDPAIGPHHKVITQ